MRHFIITILLIILIIFISLISLQKSNYNDIINQIKNKLNDNTIELISNFNNNYVIKQSTNIIVLDNNLEEIKKESIDNIKNYQKDKKIVYKNDSLLYETTIIENKKITYKYYDIWTNNEVENIIVGG